MIRKQLLLLIFRTASILRWNDYLLPCPLTELDKNAHKLMIAYVLGRIQESTDHKVNWRALVEASVFEFLRRTVLTDIKRSVFSHLVEDESLSKSLNQHVCESLRCVLEPISDDLFARFEKYFSNHGMWNNERALVQAASYLATKWEFDHVVEPFNTNAPFLHDERGHLEELLRKHAGTLHEITIPLDRLCNVFGHLRFQRRWSQSPRIPQTSVLGHSLVVSLMMYLFSVIVEAPRNRLVNNVFAALFHDLPEALTRDIVSPVKNAVEGLPKRIKEFEKDEMNKKLLSLLPEDWRSDIMFLTEYEFENRMRDGSGVKRRLSNFEIDEMDPDADVVDGSVLKVFDELAAYMEASLSIDHGVRSADLVSGRDALRAKYNKRDAATSEVIRYLDKYGLISLFDYF